MAKQPILSSGRAERRGFEYYRHSTFSLYAALDVKSGRLEARRLRHTSQKFTHQTPNFLGPLFAKTAG
jgi:hypothetical protein